MDLLHYLLLYFYAFWMGGITTTFYNRIANKLSIGNSHKPRCNFCHKDIKFPYFIPVIGFFLSGGHCYNKDCKKNIPIDYLILEIFIGILIVLLTKKYSLYTDQFLASSFFVVYLILSASIFLKEEFFPKDLLYGGIIINLIFLFYSQSPTLQDIICFTSIRFLTIFALDRKKNFFNSSEKAFLIILGISNNFIYNLFFAVIFISFYYLISHLKYFQIITQKKFLILLTIFLSYCSIFISYGF